MSRIDITMSVDGGSELNGLDVLRLQEFWEVHNKDGHSSPMHNFDRFVEQFNQALRKHKANHNTWFGCRTIHVATAMLNRSKDCDIHAVILPQRATWDAVNHAYDYLCNDRPEVADPDFDSTIRHWASANLAKFLDVDGGFSRNPTDQQDCFNLILTLQKSMQRTSGSMLRSKGFVFRKVQCGQNEHMRRSTELLYLEHYCKPLPF